MEATVQTIFRENFSLYSKTYKLSPQQTRVANDLMNCRRAILGGHAFSCDRCGHKKISYNSCRNRHCTLCQGVTKEIWVDQRLKDIVNAPYFHVVFTMPEQLHMLIYHNQTLLYDLMYKAVAETLLELSMDKKHLGAQIGFFSVLHTWGQNLHFHPHIHSVVLAGGLDDQKKWRQSSQKFFIPVKVLSKKFRGKYLSYLKQYYHAEKLTFFNELKKYEDPKQFKRLLDECYDKDWYSYTKRTFSGPEAVVRYLGRYTHRIAISNQRILSADREFVTIGVKDYKDQNKPKTVRMKTLEFMRRFLMHVLPKGFRKIRHYGLLASRNKKTKLVLCRKLTKSLAYKPKFEGLNRTEILTVLLKRDVTLCPSCKNGKFESHYSFGLP